MDDVRQDWAQDAAELAWHVSELERRARAINLRGSGHAPRAWIERELGALALALRSAHDASPLLAQEVRVRALYRWIGTLAVHGSWHSPALDVEPGTTDLSPLTVIPGYNDYERGFVGYARSVESTLERELFGDQPGHTRCLLFSSGMGALHTSLAYVSRRDRTLLVGRRVYYETRNLLASTHAGAFDRVLWFEQTRRSPPDLAPYLEHADVILVDTVSLDPEAVRVDLPRLFAQLAARSPSRFCVILDNTVPGPSFTLSAAPPANVVLYQVESLLKYYQGGLDLGAAGLLALRTSGPDPKLRDGLEAIRAANGTNINPFNLRLLPLLPRDMIVRRLQRHQRNVEIVQRELGRPVRVLGDGGLAFVDTPEPQVAVDLLQLLCLDRRCRVAQGTSFGLNRTRVCVPPNGSESIRVACGIEDELTIITQSELLRLALRVSTLKEIQADLPSFKAHFPDFPAERYPNPASRASFATAVESFCRRLREFVEGPRSDPKGA